MPRTHREYHLFGIEMFEGKAGHLFRRRKAADHQIEIAQAQLLKQNGIFSGHDLDAASGFLLQEQLHGAGHDAGRNSGQSADTDRDSVPRQLVRNRIDTLPQGRNGSTCMFQNLRHSV